MLRYLCAFVFAALVSSQALAAVGTVYVETTGCDGGSTTRCSGTTDSATPSAKGTGSTITCSATDGVGGVVPGCVITGTDTAVGQLGSIAVDGSQAVFVNCATNTFQKIFWITAVDNATGRISTITTPGTPITPTGCTAASSDWGIGGRYIYPASATRDLVVAALRAGDTLQFNNTPAAKTTNPFITAGSSGDTALGKIRVIGKAGSTITLAATGSSTNISIGASTNWYIGNLTITGTSNNSLISSSGAGLIVEGCTISATGGSTAQVGITVTANGFQILRNNIGPVTAVGINPQSSTNQGLIYGNYIHNAGGDGIQLGGAAPSHIIARNIIVNNGGRGIYANSVSVASQASVLTLIENTIYGNTGAAFEVADGDLPAVAFGNIFSNASAAGLVTWPAASVHSTHQYNVYYSSGGGVNTNWTAGTTEPVTSPAFVNVGSGDYALGGGSSAAATGFPGSMPGALSVGYADIGALQRAAGGGGGSQVFGQ